MVDVVVIGNVCYDEGVFVREDGSSDKNRTLGGACYFASSAASLFAKTGVVAKIGNDYDVSELTKNGIDVAGVKVVDGVQTTVFRTIFKSLDGQDRDIEGEVPVELYLSPSDIPKEYLKAKVFHIATNEPDIQYELVKFLKENTSAIVCIDTIYYYASNELTKKAFDLADVAIIEDKFPNLFDCNAKNKIIKHGKNGVELWQNNQRQVFENKHIVKAVVDKTGAGDVLAGSIAANLANGNNIKTSIEMAMDVASKSITDYGVQHLHDNYMLDLI